MLSAHWFLSSFSEFNSGQQKKFGHIFTWIIVQTRGTLFFPFKAPISSAKYSYEKFVMDRTISNKIIVELLEIYSIPDLEKVPWISHVKAVKYTSKEGRHSNLYYARANSHKILVNGGAKN